MDSVIPDFIGSYYSKEQLSNYIDCIAVRCGSTYGATTNKLLDLLKNLSEDATLSEENEEFVKSLALLQAQREENSLPSLFERKEDAPNAPSERFRLSFFGKFAYKALKEWAGTGDFHTLTQTLRSTIFGRNERETEEALSVLQAVLVEQHRDFNLRLAEIKRKNHLSLLNKLIERADNLSRDLLSAKKILKECVKDCEHSEPADPDNLGNRMKSRLERINALIEEVELFLKNVFSVIQTYETIQENRYKTFSFSEPSAIISHVLPAILLKEPYASTRKYYDRFFRLLIPPSVSHHLCFVSRLTQKMDKSPKYTNPLRIKSDGKAPLHQDVLLFFLTLLKQVRTGRTNLLSIMEKIPLTDGLSALFLRLHLLQIIWFQDCSFRELEEALKRNKMKDDYLGIQVETMDTNVTIGSFHMNDLSFRLMGRKG